MGMLYGAIDIHKQVFQAVTLDPGSGELVQARLAATREALAGWIDESEGRLVTVAIEATCGWRWVARELQARGIEVRLAEPAQARALKGKKRQAKTDTLDARWLVMLLAKEMLPSSWLPPADIQRLRDLTRLRQALRHDRTRWAQRLHAILLHEGWPCSRGRLLTGKGRRWLAALTLDQHVRRIVDAHLEMIGVIEEQIAEIDRELRLLARADERLLALQTIYGVGPVLACHLLAEIGDAHRFRRARQLVRLAGLDPVVLESGDSRRRGRLSKQGSPQLRWALVQAAQHAARQSSASPDRDLYLQVKKHAGSQRAALSTARKIARRAHHLLVSVEQAA
jgi:transposase